MAKENLTWGYDRIVGALAKSALSRPSGNKSAKNQKESNMPRGGKRAGSGGKRAGAGRKPGVVMELQGA